MKRIEGYTLGGSDGRPDISVHLTTKGDFEIRRDGSRDTEEFRADLTLEEARQLRAALDELLPKADDLDHFP